MTHFRGEIKILRLVDFKRQVSLNFLEAENAWRLGRLKSKSTKEGKRFNLYTDNR